MSPETCAILMPVFGSMEPETEAGIREVANRGYPVRFLRGCSQIDLARSIMASQALADGFEETFWIDADVVFDPNDIDRIRVHDKPFVAGLYPKKGRPEFACKFRHKQEMTFGEGGGLLELEYAGMGFTYIRSEVYRAIQRQQKLPGCGGGYEPGKLTTPYFIPTVIPDGSGHCYLSEDYSFCWRARQCGYPVMADTRIRLGHVHRHVLTWDDFVPRQTYPTLKMGIA